MADFEALKDQWSDVEDRDGIRLSWNTFPSSRMVRPASSVHITRR
jgi:protein transport protein SEC23